MRTYTVQLESLADTQHLASQLAEHVSVPMLLALCGPLGAGKTQLVRYLAERLGVAPELISSPTYVLMQRYRGRIDVLHLDYYRLEGAAQVWDLGLDEWLEEPALCVIEWADKFPETWPAQYLRCDLALRDDGTRQATFVACGERAEHWIETVFDELAKFR